ncbi:hypothetical protein G6F50_016660 [Rhizopus delemar]|uniref:Uncharacterized protein n=1 Tax=Rhizopus delemar TaxID=936053 RepID=A0A9P6XS98_9FUNG|nr:hypothetical protein G6F50_016660 [Rhizopus delemar]
MPALAQQADPATLDGVRVTGSKRDTPYLKSDLSVTVLDRQALKEAGVTEFRDLDKLAPNVNPIRSWATEQRSTSLAFRSVN